MKLRIVLEPSPEGGYTVYALPPGCISEGDSWKRLENIEAIDLPEPVKMILLSTKRNYPEIEV